MSHDSDPGSRGADPASRDPDARSGALPANATDTERDEDRRDDTERDGANSRDDSSAGGLKDALESCRRCGTPIATVTSVGPHEHFAWPCGCRVSASAFD